MIPMGRAIAIPMKASIIAAPSRVRRDASGRCFEAGCASSSREAGKSTSSATASRSQVYDPATDTTTIKNGGYTWFVKGNQTNMMFEAKP